MDFRGKRFNSGYEGLSKSPELNKGKGVSEGISNSKSDSRKSENGLGSSRDKLKDEVGSSYTS